MNGVQSNFVLHKLLWVPEYSMKLHLCKVQASPLTTAHKDTLERTPHCEQVTHNGPLVALMEITLDLQFIAFHNWNNMAATFKSVHLNKYL